MPALVRRDGVTVPVLVHVYALSQELPLAAVMALGDIPGDRIPCSTLGRSHAAASQALCCPQRHFCVLRVVRAQLQPGQYLLLGRGGLAWPETLNVGQT